MNRDADSTLSRCVRRVAIAIVASASAAAPALYAKTVNNLVLVPPAQLPELARQSGEALFLHQTLDGRTLLYVEHDQGARLAILDVTDPSRIKDRGSVPLEAIGPFDFVSSLGDRAALVRFRQGHAHAVLDLHNARAPTLRRIQGLTLQGHIMPLGADGFTVSAQADADASPTRDYQVVDTANLQAIKRVFDVSQVRAEISNNDTGTTFLLTDSGLYLIRRPGVESNQWLREQQDAPN
jgi:hypothetical protein